MPRISNEQNLLFPTPKSQSYIDQRKWGQNIWKPLILKLVDNGLLYKYLKFYNLRHSALTRLIRAGYDVSTVATLTGTSPEMIHRHYLAPKFNVELPLL